MRSLFEVKVNWYGMVAVLIGLLIFFPDIPLLCMLALLIASFQFLLLFYSFGYVIPVRYFAVSYTHLVVGVGQCSRLCAHESTATSNVPLVEFALGSLVEKGV